MRKKIALLISTFIFISSFSVYAQNEISSKEKEIQKVIYVSLDGNDTDDGSENTPFRTLERAQQEVRKINKEMTGDIVVLVKEGTYCLDESFKLDNQDSGTNGYNVIYRAAEDKKVVLSGGKRISGFEEGENGIWYAEAEKFEHIRNLTVNGKAALMSQTETRILSLGFYNDPDIEYKSEGFYVNYDYVKNFTNVEDMEVTASVQWTDYRTKVQKIMQDPENPERAIVICEQPFWKIQSGATYSWAHELVFTFCNGREFVDTPNEFYFDRKTKILYYMPEQNVDMTNAEVYGAVLESVIDIAGDSIYNHAANIIFDGFVIRDTKLTKYETVGHIGGQAQVGMTNAWYGWPHGAINLDNASNIKIENCVITGIGGVGIDLAESVYDTEIIGNAIYDIGDSAAVVGRPWHSGIKEREPWNPDGPKNIFGHKPVYFSSLGAEYSDGGIRGETPVREFISSSEPLDSGGFWGTAQFEADEGKLGWFKIDLLKEYLIDNVEFRYGKYEELGKSEKGRQNFQILLSNDPEFSDYEVIHEQGADSAKDTFSASYKGENKYRYVMIRKTKPEPLIVGYVHVYSWDEPNERTMDPCKNITFKNNYITRVGNYVRMSPGVTAFYLDSLYFEHNEIHNVPYSGMSLGWGWNNCNWQYVARNYQIKSNKIESWNEECYDGGAVYMLGGMPGSVLSENYFIGGRAPYGAIYHDSGASGITSFDNVAENVTLVCNIGDTNKNVHTYNTYTNIPNRYGSPYGSTLENYFPENNALVEPTIDYTLGKEFAKVLDIKENAGLEEKYKFLSVIVPENTKSYGQSSEAQSRNSYDALTSGWESFMNDPLMSGLTETIKHSDFGKLPGQISPEIYFEIQLLEAEYKAGTTDVLRDAAVKGTRVFNLLNKLENFIYRMSYDELLAYCKNMSVEAVVGDEIGCYSKYDITKFKNLISSVEKSEGTENEKILKLEAAVAEFYDSGIHAEILAAIGNDQIATIDSENRVIHFELDSEEKIKNVKCKFLANKGVNIHLVTDGVFDLSSPKQVALYSEKIKKPVIWTVEASVQEGKNESWYHLDNIKPLDEDGTILRASEIPYMYVKEKISRNTNISFTADKVAIDAGITLILSADSPNIWVRGTEKANDHHEIVLKGDTIELYRVSEGISKKISSAAINNVSENHNFNLEVDGKLLRVYYNGKLLIHTLLPETAEGSYMGLRPNLGVIRNVSIQVD